MAMTVRRRLVKVIARLPVIRRWFWRPEELQQAEAEAQRAEEKFGWR